MDVWTARHEAGHALIAYALLGDVGLVRVHARGGGVTDVPGLGLLSAEDRATVALAGEVAEAIGRNDRTPALSAARRLQAGGKGLDVAWLDEALEELAGGDRRRRDEAALAAALRAEQIIRGNADLFLRMVDQLVDVGIMTGGQVGRWLDPPKPAAKPTPRATIPPMTWNDGPLPKRYSAPARTAANRGRTLTAGELRGQADKAERAGNEYAARLMRQSAARMDGNTAAAGAGLSRSVANINGREVR